jgi:DNA-binding CsgD family transcriptional regulator
MRKLVDLEVVGRFMAELDQQAGLDAIATRAVALLGRYLRLTSAELRLAGVEPEPYHYVWHRSAAPLGSVRPGSPLDSSIGESSRQPLTARGFDVGTLRVSRPGGALCGAERRLLETLGRVLALVLHDAQLTRGLELAERITFDLARRPPVARPPREVRTGPEPWSPGGERLTARERAVLLELAGGCTTHVLARRLSVSQRTIEGHLTAIFGKLQVSNRTHAVARAQELGLLAASRTSQIDNGVRACAIGEASR